MHVAPSATANGDFEVYGAPPLSMVPSEQLRLQPTSSGYDPPEQVIAEEMIEGSCEVGGEGGEDGEGGPQQASLQFAESFFFFLWHKFVHFSRFPPPLHALFTCFWSHFLHVFLSLSAWQFFGDGLGAVTLRLISRPFAMNDSGRTESNETEDGGA